MKWVFGSILFLLTATVAFFFFLQGHENRLILDAKKDLSRLSYLTVRVFQAGRTPSENVFWKELGRADPLKDPWGTVYRLRERDIQGKKAYLWSSAGADRQWDTSDDQFYVVPYGSDGRLDGDGLERGEIVRQAR